ncbi:MAG: hypothetical protein U1D35_10335 [Paracoccaceae bacterium]|nr:hypothetical protein [Paracoccaceae bacterium]
MRQHSSNLAQISGNGAFLENDFHVIIVRLTCACVESVGDDEVPLARAMFQNVEVEGLSTEQAARALGIHRRDGAYLLAGLRRDVATKLALVLLDGLVPGRTDGSG